MGEHNRSESCRESLPADFNLSSNLKMRDRSENAGLNAFSNPISTPQLIAVFKKRTGLKCYGPETSQDLKRKTEWADEFFLQGSCIRCSATE
jgi:hypothetical protein